MHAYVYLSFFLVPYHLLNHSISSSSLFSLSLFIHLFFFFPLVCVCLLCVLSSLFCLSLSFFSHILFSSSLNCSFLLYGFLFSSLSFSPTPLSIASSYTSLYFQSNSPAHKYIPMISTRFYKSQYSPELVAAINSYPQGLSVACFNHLFALIFL